MDNKSLLIYSNQSCHFEIIESIIVKYRDIIKFDVKCNIYIFFDFKETVESLVYKQYISIKYKNAIIFKNIEDYDFLINITIYPEHYDELCDKNTKKLPTNYFAIAHRVNHVYENDTNVFYLTKLSKHNVFDATILPFSQYRINMPYPIILIQGNISKKRRDYDLLLNLLDFKTHFDYKIKILGRGEINKKSLDKYSNKLIVNNDLHFIDYHKQFANCYAICPLISKEKQPQYYNETMTSSINYAKGYQLKTFLDEDLQQIYKLPNSVVYNSSNMISQFSKLIQEYYNKRICGIYIEPRDLLQVYKNIDNFHEVLPGSVLYFFCGKGLIDKYRATLKGKNVKLFELSVDNLNFQTYSNLMKSEKFWEYFDSSHTHAITIQSDGCLCSKSKLSVWDFIHYDYVGGFAQEGWWWKETCGLHYKDDYQCFNGGISLRNIETCRKIVKKYPSTDTKTFYKGCQISFYPEDLYFVACMLKENYNVGTDKFATLFCSHTTFIPGSFALHKINKYINQDKMNKVLEYCPEFKFFL